jgi:hypothetical protein
MSSLKFLRLMIVAAGVLIGEIGGMGLMEESWLLTVKCLHASFCVVLQDKK